MASNKLGVVCVSGSHEKLQMAAMMAASAAVSGTDVTVFFSMNALPYFIKGQDLKTPVEGQVGELLAQENVPPFKQLFEQAKELGDAKLFPCSMAMDVLKAQEKDLEEMMGEPMGLTKFLSDSADGQLIVF